MKKIIIINSPTIIFSKRLLYCCIAFISFANSISAQQNVFSRSEAGTGDWGSGNLPWFYESSNNSQGDPDNNNAVRNFVKIGHNNNTTMNTNSRFYRVNTLDFEAGASSVRTINNSGGGLSVSGGIYNGSVATHVFNTPIGIDGELVQLHANSSGGLNFNSTIFINANTVQFGNAGAGNITVSGNMEGLGQVQKIGNNTLILSGANTYTGATTLTSGTLILNKTGGATIPSANNINVNGGTLRISSNQSLSNLTLTSGGLTVDSGVILTLTNPTIPNGFVISNNGTIAISGSLTDNRIIKSYAGTIQYNGGDQTIVAASYNNLTLLNSGLKTFSGTANISGNFVVTDASVILPSLITFNGTLTQNIAGLDYKNIKFDGLGTKNFTSSASINSTSTITFAGDGAVVDFDGISDDLTFQLKSDGEGTASVGNAIGWTLNGKVTVERYIPAKRAWRALTAPLQGSEASIYVTWQNNGTVSTGTGVEIWGPAGTGMAVGSSYSALEYTPSGYVNVTNTQTKNLFETNKNNAYLIFVTGGYGSGNIANTVPAQSTTLKATGKLITGDVTRSSIIDTRHTMIGNPYASPMSPATLLTNSSNLINKFWVWDSNLAGTGGYVMYDPIAATYSNSAGSYASSSTAIQSGQAFFVRATTGNTGSLTLTENNKSGTMTNAVFSDNTPEIFRLAMYRQQSTGWLPVDGAIAAMYPSANPEVDANDGRKFVNSFENIAFRRNNTSLSSEHLLPLVAQDTLYFRVWNTTPNTYKLHLNTESFTTTGLVATLQDLYTNTNTVLNLDGSVNEYLFDVTTNEATANDRFRIVFSTDENLATNNSTKSPFVIAPNPVTNQIVTIYNQDNKYQNLKYMLVNALGQVVSKGNVNANNTINVANIAAGMYIMKLQTENNAVYTSKLIIK